MPIVPYCFCSTFEAPRWHGFAIRAPVQPCIQLIPTVQFEPLFMSITEMLAPIHMERLAQKKSPLDRGGRYIQYWDAKIPISYIPDSAPNWDWKAPDGMEWDTGFWFRRQWGHGPTKIRW